MSASGRVHGRKTPSDRRLPLRLLQTCVQTLGRVQDSLPAWLCSPNVPSAKPPPPPPPASAPDGREQGGPERGLPAQDTGAPGLARPEEWERRRRQPPLGRPPLLGGPGHAPTGHPVLRGQRGHRGTAPPCLQGRGPPAPGSADSRSSAKTSVCQCPSLQPTDNFTGVWKALLKLTKHRAVYPGRTPANCARKASRLPHTGSPGCDRPPLAHGWHTFSAHLYAATLEKTLMLGGTGGRRRREQQRMR